MKIILSMIAICLFSFGALIGCDKAEEPKKTEKSQTPKPVTSSAKGHCDDSNCNGPFHRPRQALLRKKQNISLVLKFLDGG